MAKNIESKIIYEGPTEKANDIKQLVAELFDTSYLEDPDSQEDITLYQDEAWKKTILWARHASIKMDVPFRNLLRINLLGSYNLNSFSFPKEAQDSTAYLYNGVSFKYKGYQIRIGFKGLPEVFADGKIQEKLPKRIFHEHNPHSSKN